MCAIFYTSGNDQTPLRAVNIVEIDDFNEMWSPASEWNQMPHQLHSTSKNYWLKNANQRDLWANSWIQWLQITNVNQLACWLNHNTAPTFIVPVIESSRDRTESRDLLGIRFDFHPGMFISDKSFAVWFKSSMPFFFASYRPWHSSQRAHIFPHNLHNSDARQVWSYENCNVRNPSGYNRKFTGIDHLILAPLTILVHCFAFAS